MKKYEKIIKETIVSEGHYSNDSSDRGGETVYGISRKNWPKFKGWEYIKNPYDERIKKLAIEFYKDEFYDKLRCDDIFENSVSTTLFDYAVNAGRVTAVKTIQSAVGSSADGIIGPITIGKINKLALKNPTDLHLKMLKAKLSKYSGIVEHNDSQKKYLFGWVSRAFHNIEYIYDIKELSKYKKISKISELYDIMLLGRNDKSYRTANKTLRRIQTIIRSLKV